MLRAVASCSLMLRILYSVRSSRVTSFHVSEIRRRRFHFLQHDKLFVGGDTHKISFNLQLQVVEKCLENVAHSNNNNNSSHLNELQCVVKKA